MAAGNYRFSFGPWNISTGADPFGPAVRKEVPFAKKIAEYRKLGFTYVQLHDDDVVPADWDATQTAKGVRKVKKMLDGEGLKGEFVAPRLWEDPRTADGGYTANKAAHRNYARDRSRRSVDIANMMDIDLIVLWPAREGTYIREAKENPHRRRNEAQRTDGPGLLPHGGPFHGPDLPHDGARSRGSADRERP
jgi:xylose isomerase